MHQLFTKQQIFGLYKTESISRRQNKCESKIEICVGKGSKHCGKRTKNWFKNQHFLLSPQCFQKTSFARSLKNGTVRERVKIHSHTTTPFDTPGKQAFWKHCWKGEIARNEQFLLFPQCFLLVWITFCHFRQIWNCHLQTFFSLKSLKFVVWSLVTPPYKENEFKIFK